ELIPDDPNVIQYVPVLEWIFDIRKRLGRISFSIFAIFALMCILWLYDWSHLFSFLTSNYYDVFTEAWWRVTSGSILTGVSHVILVFLIWLWSIKRLNDSNRSRWWLLATFFPIAGNAFLFFLLFLPNSFPKENAFGKSEKLRLIVHPEPDELPLV
ncbi:MAG: DUF805 domain-containing protein, partial [Bacteroidota bacterium]